MGLFRVNLTTLCGDFTRLLVAVYIEKGNSSRFLQFPLNRPDDNNGSYVLYSAASDMHGYMLTTQFYNTGTKTFSCIYKYNLTYSSFSDLFTTRFL